MTWWAWPATKLPTAAVQRAGSSRTAPRPYVSAPVPISWRPSKVMLYCNKLLPVDLLRPLSGQEYGRCNFNHQSKVVQFRGRTPSVFLRPHQLPGEERAWTDLSHHPIDGGRDRAAATAIARRTRCLSRRVHAHGKRKRCLRAPASVDPGSLCRGTRMRGPQQTPSARTRGERAEVHGLVRRHRR